MGPMAEFMGTKAVKGTMAGGCDVCPMKNQAYRHEGGIVWEEKDHSASLNGS